MMEEDKYVSLLKALARAFFSKYEKENDYDYLKRIYSECLEREKL